MEYLLRGILIGLLFGLPVGAIGALTVQRTWSLGAKAGLLTGLGSTAADCFYACVGAFGLTLISDFLLHFQGIITALGGILILVMGLKSLTHPQGELPPDEETLGGAKLFLTSFAIVQMARELGLNPDKLGKIDNHQQESWPFSTVGTLHHKAVSVSDCFSIIPFRLRYRKISNFFFDLWVREMCIRDRFIGYIGAQTVVCIIVCSPSCHIHVLGCSCTGIDCGE